jgi:hypothetical protein
MLTPISISIFASSTEAPMVGSVLVSWKGRSVTLMRVEAHPPTASEQDRVSSSA